MSEEDKNNSMKDHSETTGDMLIPGLNQIGPISLINPPWQIKVSQIWYFIIVFIFNITFMDLETFSEHVYSCATLLTPKENSTE